MKNNSQHPSIDNMSKQSRYYWKHREEIRKKRAKLSKNPEYRKHRAEIALKSYYKRKEEKCQTKKQSSMTEDGNTK